MPTADFVRYVNKLTVMGLGTDLQLVHELRQPGGRIVLLVMDGLGGLPLEPQGLTELETAHTPHMDRLASEGSAGLSVPIRPGIEPGSGPAHLALFGYDPVAVRIGRGVLEALGIGFALQPGDLAARGNFATVDQAGRIVDRRAGRIPTEECQRLTALLERETGHLFPGYEVFVRPVKEHRFVLVLRGPGLGGELTETDPLQTGVPPLPVEDRSSSESGRVTAQLVNSWIAVARELLASEAVANSLNLRALGTPVALPSFEALFGLRGAAIAAYPMYRGLASLVGMAILPCPGEKPGDAIDVLTAHWDQYDFFFLHFKKTDSYGEDGNFDAKVAEIEAVDAQLPRLLALRPEVLIVTGDHSTPAVLRQHSWHPVPTLLWGWRAMPSGVARFGERACAGGNLGLFPATSLIPQALAHAGRLRRFGA